MTDTKLCPFCGEEIKAVAIKCKHCGERLDLSAPPATGIPANAGPSLASAVTQAPGGGEPSSGSVATQATVVPGAALGNAPPGTKLGSYILGDVLGTGGMGSVYRARHERLGQPVAIKVLSPNLASDAGLIGRFEQEARLQANLRHPNIVAVTDFLVEGGLCAFVMELVEGHTLSDLIRQTGGPLPLERCRDLLLPVLDALSFAHERGVIHRDIKPSNILITSAGARETVKVMDFGIAKALGGAKRTATGSMMGTLHYMSPEQCQGAGNVDARSDLYSIAVTLYEMATGRVPFDLDSEYALMSAHIMDPPPPPSQINPSISPQLEEVILRALAKDPDQRFQTSGELAEALRQVDARPVLAAIPPTQWQETPATPASSPGWQPAPPTPAPPPQWGPPVPARAPTSSKTPLLVLGGAGVLAVLILIAVLVLWVFNDDEPDTVASSSSAWSEQPAPSAPTPAPPASRDDQRSKVLKLPPGAVKRPRGSRERGDAPAPARPERITGLRAAASSSSRGYRDYRYDPGMAIDGREDTWWQESADGDGIGEWLQINWSRTWEVTKIRIVPGYMSYRNDRYGDRWPLNNRVRRARFSFSSGRSLEHTFPDRREWHTVEVSPPVRARWAKVTILDVHESRRQGRRRWHDSGISEIEVWGIR